MLPELLLGACALLATIVSGSHDHVGDHIIDLIPKCPKKHINKTATLTVMADVPVHAIARCHRNVSYVFKQDWNEVTYTLKAGFNRNHYLDRCVFDQKDGTDTFTLAIEIGWGDRGSPVFSSKERYIVTCSYGDKGLSVSENQLVDDWYISPISKQRMMGRKTKKATFDLKIVDLYDKPITKPLALGRKVRLKAVCKTAKKYIRGFRVIGCTAYSDVDSYDVLRGGCGDGLVFDKKTGFKTEGLVIRSPFFETFKLKGRTVLNFACNFTLCKHDCDAKPPESDYEYKQYRLCKRRYNCDGDSCKNILKKRQTGAIEHVDEEVFTALTFQQALTEDGTIWPGSIYFQIISPSAPISIRFSLLFLFAIVAISTSAAIYMCNWHVSPERLAKMVR